MSYNKTDGIPHDHPLAQLLARSQKANKLPSCEGCRIGSLDVPEDRPPFLFCELADAPKSPIVLDDSRCGIEVIHFRGHFCAAWEPKA
jgi:hypothetical protein